MHLPETITGALARRLAPLLLSIVLGSGLCGEAIAATPSERTRLLEAEDALFRADVMHDTAAVERGFADEAVFVHANGMIQTKAEYLEAMKSHRVPITSVEAKDRVVRIIGRVGIVRGVKSLVIGDMHLSGSYLTVYLIRGGRWQMLSEQSSPAPEHQGTP